MGIRECVKVNVSECNSLSVCVRVSACMLGMSECVCVSMFSIIHHRSSSPPPSPSACSLWWRKCERSS